MAQIFIANKISFDIAGIKRKLEERIIALQRAAARAFLTAALERIPTYTGESRGAFLPLAKELGISIKIAPRSTGTEPKFWRIPFKSPSSGADQSSFGFTKERGRFIFRFQSNVVQFRVNEFFRFLPPEIPLGGSQSAPWHSLEAGREAYKNYIQQNARGLLKDIVVKARISKGSDNG